MLRFETLKNGWKDGIAALERGRRFVTHDIWRIGMPGEQIPNGFIIKNIRVVILLVRGVTDETLLLRASALTFATILFLVPFLAFMFAFIQTFDLGDQIYSQMSETLDKRLSQFAELVRTNDSAPGTTQPIEDSTAPPSQEAVPDASDASQPAAPPTIPEQASQNPEQASKNSEQTLENNAKLRSDLIATLFPGWNNLHDAAGEGTADPVQIVVEIAERGATNPRALSVAGIFYALTTVLGLMRNVELAFNGIWGVKRARSPIRTISDYLVITLLLPFVAAGVLGITAALAAKGDMSPVLALFARGGQLAVICFTFSLVYFVVPNTRVQYRNALLGGVVAGILWTALSYGYISVQVGLARYALFFSTFALFPLLLMWLYLSWLVLLFGSLISFAYQNEKTFAMERLAAGASFAYREALAVRLALEMAARFKHGGSPLVAASVAEAWNVPVRLVNDTLDDLAEASLVTACATEPVSYQPGRAPITIRLLDVLQALRQRGEDPSLLREEPAFRDLYATVDDSQPETLLATVDALADRYVPAAPPPKGEIKPFRNVATKK